MMPFDFSDLVPLNRTPSDLNSEVADKIARFRSVFFPYPPHVVLHDRCD